MNNVERICQWMTRIGFGLLFIIVPLILTPWNYELFEYNKMMWTYGITTLIMSGWIGTMIARQEIRIPKTPLDLPIFLFFLSQLISTLFSIDPHVSWFGYYSRFNGGMFSVITYILLYYAGVATIEKKHIVRYLSILLITALAISLYGILEHFGIDKHLWVQDVQSRVFSTLGQPNWLAAYLVALFPIALTFSMRKMMKHATVAACFYGCISIVFFVTLLWTRSRSGLLGFIVADGCLFFLLFGKYLRSPSTLLHDWQTKFRTNAVAVLYLIIHSILLFAVIGNGIYVENIDQWITVNAWQRRITTLVQKKQAPIPIEASASGQTTTPTGPALETGGTESGTIRKYVWQAAMNAWKSSTKTMLIGTGTETFAFAFYQHKPLGHNMTSEWDFLYNKAHNEFLNYLATTGVFGFGSYCFLIGTFLLWSFQFLLKHIPQSLQHKSSKDTGDTPNRDIAMICSALIAGWLSIPVTNFFGFSVVIIQILFFLMPAFAFILTEQEKQLWNRPLKLKQYGQTFLIVCTWTIAFIIGVLLVITWYGDVLFSSGYHLSRMGYGADAYKRLKNAIAYNPGEPLYHDELGTTLAGLSLAAWNSKESSLAAELAEQSMKENDTALSISPNNVNFWKSRTKILYTIASMDEAVLPNAIKALQKAHTLSPMDPKILYNLAILYGRAGLLDKGIETLVKAKELKPNYRDAYYGLAVFYKEKGQTDLMQSIADEYLQKFNPRDQEFLDVIK